MLALKQTSIYSTNFTTMSWALINPKTFCAGRTRTTQNGCLQPELLMMDRYCAIGILNSVECVVIYYIRPQSIVCCANGIGQSVASCFRVLQVS